MEVIAQSLSRLNGHSQAIGFFTGVISIDPVTASYGAKVANSLGLSMAQVSVAKTIIVPFCQKNLYTISHLKSAASLPIAMLKKAHCRKRLTNLAAKFLSKS
jgi:hypothetical protein